MDQDHTTTHPAFAYLILSAAALYAYLCVPRAVLDLVAPSSELQLSHGFLDQTLAYVGVLTGAYALAAASGRAWVSWGIRAWWHAEFLVRSGEAILLYRFGIGYSPLVLYHVDRVSLGLAISQERQFILALSVVVATADWVFRRLAAPRVWRPVKVAERVAIVLVLAFAVRCVFVLHRERARLPEDFAVVSLAENWSAYARTSQILERLSLTSAEHARLNAIGIRFSQITNAIPRPRVRRNLITIYLEGFQANFTASGGNVYYPGLTPNLDRLAQTSVVYNRFYNAVTPTINSIVSSQCGILAQVENDELDIDRGYTRNLTCLSDVLHDAGYYQVFLGGADSGFSGKRLFLAAHHYNEVWGWERWSREHPSTRNVWGLQDTDLVRQAVARLPDLRSKGPFHLTLLTVNTHQPGFVANDCSTYLEGRLMLNAIHCTDHAIGLLMEALEAGGYLDDTVVIMMGDHMMFPSPQNVAALGPASAGWFGQVFMAMHEPRRNAVSDRSTGVLGYTPDLAPTALDALGFTPVPRFPIGQSLLGPGNEDRVLVAPRYQVIGGRMVPERPALTDECSDEMVAQAVLNDHDRAFGDCERDKIVDIIQRSLLASVGSLLERRTN